MARKRKYMPQTRIESVEYRIATHLFHCGLSSTRDIFAFFLFDGENEKRILNCFVEKYQYLSSDYINIDNVTINNVHYENGLYKIAPYAGLFDTRWAVMDNDTKKVYSAVLNDGNLETRDELRLMF